MSGAAEVANATTSAITSGASGIGVATGLRTQTVQVGEAFIPRKVTQGAAMHETATSIQFNDADKLAANPQMTSQAFAEASAAEPTHEQSTARTSVTNEELSGRSTPTPTPDNLNNPASAEGAAPSVTTLAGVSNAVQAGADAARSSATPMTDRATPRTAHRNSAGETVSGATPVAAVQPGIIEAAASSQLRNSGAPDISAAQASGHQQTAPATSAAVTAQDTFSMLDSGTSPGAPSLTHAGSQHAEAGFRDPALGWVGVRADLNGDGIHATLVPSSAEAVQALNGHLAGLSSHLAEQQSPIASLTMASPSESGTENGMGQRMQQGAEGNPQGNAPDESPAGSQLSASLAMSSAIPGAPAQPGTRDPVTYSGELRGTHISVMA